MKYARPDYDRIQGPAGKIPDDEPMFLLRGQDECAAEAVHYYAWLCRQKGAFEVAAAADDHARAMQEWPTKKVPDL
jgi:hypothetical protein